MKNSQRAPGWILIAVTTVLLFALPVHAAAEKIRVATLYIGSSMLPLWMAKDEGDFARRGLEVDDPKVHGGSTSISIYFSDPDGYQLEFSAKFSDAESHKKAMERLGATYGGTGTRTYEWKDA